MDALFLQMIRENIITATILFRRLPMDGGRFERLEDRAYDHAYETSGNCEKLYPTCPYSIYDMDFWNYINFAIDFASETVPQIVVCIHNDRHDDRTSDGDRLVAETLAKFFWRLDNFSALIFALTTCVLFREYRSSITDKTRGPIA